MLEYFHPWTNDAGFYAAAAAGHYEAQGLDVEIVVGDPLRGDALSHLVRDEADFAVCPTTGSSRGGTATNHFSASRPSTTAAWRPSRRSRAQASRGCAIWPGAASR